MSKPITDAMVAAFKDAWHKADERGDSGNRVRTGLAAAIAAQSEPATDEPGPRDEDMTLADRRLLARIQNEREQSAPEPADQGEEPRGLLAHWERSLLAANTPAPPADREQQRAATLPDTDRIMHGLMAALPDDQWGQFYATYRAAGGQDSQPARNDIARVIWETSRNDEGTISAMGANIVADAILAKYTILAEPPKPYNEAYEEGWDAGWEWGYKKSPEPASGQPGRVVASMPIEHAAYVDIEVRAAEDRAVAMVGKRSLTDRRYTDEAVARIRAEGYITVDTLVEALRAERDEWSESLAPNAATIRVVFADLADRLAQGVQPDTEKEGDR